MWITRGVGALRTRALPIAVVLVAVAGALSVFRAEALLPVAGPDDSGTGLVTQLPPDASVTPSPAVQQCTAPDNGTGTVTLPVLGCEYSAPDEVLQIIDGLPPGTTIELDPILMDFLCSDPAICSLPLAPGQCETAGGSLGGHGCCADATLDLTVSGTGDLTGFNRHLAVPVALEAHSGPRTPGDPVQTFPRDMYRFFGELFGDPDFCEFRITAGTDYGLPGPGQTTLTELPGGDFTVDSFFDLTYQIEFEGCPGSVLDGYMGTTTGTIRIEIPDDATEWSELLYPLGHPLVGQSIDLAFALSGREGAPCIDRDGDTSCWNPTDDPDDDGCTTAQEAGLPGGNFDGNVWYDVFDVGNPSKEDAVGDGYGDDLPPIGANGARNRVVDMIDVIQVLNFAFAEEGGAPNGNGMDYDAVKGWDGDGDTNTDVTPHVLTYYDAGPPVVNCSGDGVAYDRTSGGGVPAPAAGPPNCVIDMIDVITVLNQAFQVDCSGSP